MEVNCSLPCGGQRVYPYPVGGRGCTCTLLGGGGAEGVPLPCGGQRVYPYPVGGRGCTLTLWGVGGVPVPCRG